MTFSLNSDDLRHGEFNHNLGKRNDLGSKLLVAIVDNEENAVLASSARKHNPLVNKVKNKVVLPQIDYRK